MANISSILTRNRRRKALEDLSVDCSEGLVNDPGLCVSQAQINGLMEREEKEELRKAELFERWLHSPERTKKWRLKLKQLEEAEAAQTKGPLTDVWIQCEQQSCLKWRRITSEHFKTLDERAPWMCHLNPDPLFSKCSVPQEDASAEERLAKKLGVKYIVSSYPEGTLVLAKMSGFQRWPAIISQDPMCGQHVFEDSDGEALSYHVEYMGQVHTHSWIGARQVEAFHDSGYKPNPGLGSKAKKKGSSSGSNKSSFRKNGIRCTLDGAMAEAMTFVGLDFEGMMKKVMFRCADDDGRSPSQVTSKGFQSPRPCTESASLQSSPEPAKLDCQLNTSMLNCSKQEKFSADLEMYLKNQKAFEHDVRRFMIRSHHPISRLPYWHNTEVRLFQLFLAVHERGGFYKVTENKQWISVYREVTGFDGATSGSHAKVYYKRNLLPYEFYIAKKDYQHCFMERKRVHSKKSKSKSGPKAKVKSGQDGREQDPVEMTKTGTHEQTLISDESRHSNSRQRSGSHLKTEWCLSDGPSQDRVDADKPSSECDLREIDSMMDQLDTYSSQCFLNHVDTRDSQHSDIMSAVGVTFYDESPSFQPRFRQADTASEFGTACLPVESTGIQEVPDLEFYPPPSGQSSYYHDLSNGYQLDNTATSQPQFTFL